MASSSSALQVSDSVFNAYVGLLALAGVVQLVVAAVGFGAKMGTRIFGGILGIGFLGYAAYLHFFFNDGSFVMFWYAFIAPVALLAQVFRNRQARGQQAPYPQPEQLQAYPQPGQPAQQQAYPPPVPAAQPQAYPQAGQWGQQQPPQAQPQSGAPWGPQPPYPQQGQQPGQWGQPSA